MRNLLAFALLGCLAAGFWIHRIDAERTGAERVWIGSDLTCYFHPTAGFIHDRLHDGDLPLWNPYQYAGQPFLALHVPAVLYPPNLALLGLFSTDRALALHAILHLLAAGFFSWLFTGQLGLGPAARGVAALAYMLSTPMLLSIQMVAYLSTQTWLPAMLWAVHGLLRDGGVRWAIVLAACSALAFLGGHAQGFLIAVQFVFAYGVFGLVVVTPAGRRLRVLGLAALSGVLTAGLAAPQLLPALELAGGAVRGMHGLAFGQAAFGPVRPSVVGEGVLGWVLSGNLVPPADPGAWSIGLLVQWTAVGLPLAICGVLARRQRPFWIFFVTATALAALFMMGARTPVFRLYYMLPGGNLFRAPMRLSFLYMFLVGVLVALGVQGIGDLLRRSGHPRAAAVTAAALLLVTAADLYHRTAFPRLHPVLSTYEEKVPARLRDALRSEARTTRTFVGEALFGQVRREPPRLDMKGGMFNQIPMLPDYEPNTARDYVTYFYTSPLPVWHGGLRLERTRGGRGADALGRLLDLMSVGSYVVAASPPGWEARLPAWVPRLFPGSRREIDGYAILTRPTSVPRAYVVGCTRYAPDLSSSLKAILSEDFAFRREAVVTGRVAGEPARLLTGPCTDTPEGTRSAAIRTESADEVVIDAACTSRCLVVLTDLHYPGWHVNVDGNEQPMERVNGIFRGVYVDAGSHEITYRFAPRTFTLGLWLCGASMLVAGGLWLTRPHRVPPPARAARRHHTFV